MMDSGLREEHGKIICNTRYVSLACVTGPLCIMPITSACYQPVIFVIFVRSFITLDR
jgi:hypothetical protein